MKPSFKVTFVFNNVSWSSVSEKVKDVVKFFSPVITIEPTIKFTNFVNIPFVNVDTIDGIQNTPSHTNTVSPDWFDLNPSSISPEGTDMVVFYMPSGDLPPMQTSVGIMQGKHYRNIIQACIFGIKENDRAYQYINGMEVDQGNACAVFICHEISHALYMVQGKPDNTHAYFYSGQSEKVLDEIKDGKLTGWFQMVAYLNQLVLLLTLKINEQKIMEPKNEQPVQKYFWDTPADARHSARVICDEEGLNLKQKNDVTACIQEESRFNPKAIGKINKDGTQDFGIVQMNNGKNKNGVPYWIGKGCLFESVDEVLNNPERGVRFMARETKKYGYPKWWSSWTTGAYKKWL